MAEIINLRLAKKALARSEAEKRAAENRVKFGRTKREKSAMRAEKNRADAAHDAKRLEKDGENTVPGVIVEPG